MSDNINLNTVLNDINTVSVYIFEAREDFRQAFPPLPLEDEIRLSNPQAEVLSKLNEAMMLIDDAMAIMVDEMGAMFEKDEWEGDPRIHDFDIGGEG